MNFQKQRAKPKTIVNKNNLYKSYYYLYNIFLEKITILFRGFQKKIKLIRKVKRYTLQENTVYFLYFHIYIHI